MKRNQDTRHRARIAFCLAWALVSLAAALLLVTMPAHARKTWRVAADAPVPGTQQPSIHPSLQGGALHLVPAGTRCNCTRLCVEPDSGWNRIDERHFDVTGTPKARKCRGTFDPTKAPGRYCAFDKTASRVALCTPS